LKRFAERNRGIFNRMMFVNVQFALLPRALNQCFPFRAICSSI
jgi:hypothetical protein